MTYVFDSSSLIVLFRHYYPHRFPSLWERFDALVLERRIVSVREVRKELEECDDRLSDWVKDNSLLFPVPGADELDFVLKIFEVRHFQALVRKKERLNGSPVADPFVIAKAKVLVDGCVVTQEVCKPNGSRIPNVCEHFDIPCLNLEAFMETERWRF